MLEFLEGGYTRVMDAIRKAGCDGIEELHKKARLELANRTVDPNDPDIAIWDPEHVEILFNGE